MPRALRHTRYLVLAALVLGALGFLNFDSGPAIPVLDPQSVLIVLQQPSPLPVASTTPLPSATAVPTGTATNTATATATATPTATPIDPPGPPVRGAGLLGQAPTDAPTPVPAAVSTPARTAHVPIVLYHYIRPYPDRSVDPLGYNLSVPPDLFDQELDYLKGQGFQTIRLADLTNYLRSGAPPLPPKPIVITFDDGYADAYLNAFPSLKERGMVGTFFIVPGFIDRGLANYVTWDQVKEMGGAGMEIGAHTMNHVDLTLKPPAEAEQEIAQSQQELQEHLGAPVQVFAYPYGHVNLTVEQITARYFIAAATTAAGTHEASDAVYLLRRVEISGAFNFLSFVQFFNYWYNGPR